MSYNLIIYRYNIILTCHIQDLFILYVNPNFLNKNNHCNIIRNFKRINQDVPKSLINPS